MMRLNDDLSIRVSISTADMTWTPSPVAGVERRMLYRVGNEAAIATSIVRYAPGSRFAAHEHPGGEEILVLEGTFQDRNGNYPAGSYMRNPPGSSHEPASETGCTILVKLRQFGPGNHQPVVRMPGQGNPAAPRSGASSAHVLFEGCQERVSIEEWPAGTTVEIGNRDGLELFLVDGSIEAGDKRFDRWTWLRLPKGGPLRGKTGMGGLRIWLKEAPLGLGIA